MAKNTKYRAEHDGLQWSLIKERDVKNRETGEISRKEMVVGYYPRLHQVASKMYEQMVADKLDGKFDSSEMLSAIAKAGEVFDMLKKIDPEQLQNGVDA
jgi:hypothetical protein